MFFNIKIPRLGMTKKAINLGMTAFLLITGCGWVGEKAPPKERLTKDYALSSSPSCQIHLDKIKNHFERGVLKEEELFETIDCAIVTLRDIESKIEPAEKGVLTRREIETLLHSKILGDPQKLRLWIERLFSAQNLLLGEQHHNIHFSEIEQILGRVKRASQKILVLSKILFAYDQTTPMEELYWEFRKNLFSAYVDLFQTLLKNVEGVIDHDISKELLFNQYRLWDGLEKEVGTHYIEAGYLAQRVLFGESETIIRGFQLPETLNILVSVYSLVTEINRHLSKEFWTSKDSLSFLYTYQSLFETLLKVFFERNIPDLKKGDLIPLLEFLHADNGGRAREFVEAVYEFKKQLFGGNLETLERNEVKELLHIFNEGLLMYERSSALFPEGVDEINQWQLTAWINAHEKNLSPELKQKFERMVLDFSKILYLWTTPFQRTGVVRKHPFILTQTAFVLVDRIVSAYDKNHDGKLSMIPLDAVSSLEIGNTELTSFLSTLQKLLKGLDLLTERDKNGDRKDHHRIWTNPLDLDTIELGKILILLSDQLLYTSNGDQTLDRHEIIEATSFILENNRAVSWFYWDPQVIPFHHPFPDSTEMGLLRKNLVESLKNVPTLQWYFPMAMKALSEKDIQRYIGAIIEIIGRNHSEILSVKELAVIFLMVRIVENLFLRFDDYQDGVLNKGEIRRMYRHFEPTIAKLLQEYNSRPDAFEKIPLFGSVGKFLFLFLNKFLIPFVNKEEICRRAFEYSLSHGRLPESETDLLFSSSKIQSDRLKVVTLIAYIMRDYLIKNPLK